MKSLHFLLFIGLALSSTTAFSQVRTEPNSWNPIRCSVESSQFASPLNMNVVLQSVTGGGRNLWDGHSALSIDEQYELQVSALIGPTNGPGDVMWFTVILVQKSDGASVVYKAFEGDSRTDGTQDLYANTTIAPFGGPWHVTLYCNTEISSN